MNCESIIDRFFVGGGVMSLLWIGAITAFVLNGTCYLFESWLRSICLTLEAQSRTLSSHRSACALRPASRAFSARLPHS
jgi:hypothetical protein